uniref:Uncharacterized protein n=1 Tax=Arundo donax TaxID=35708 RepID=A0A0A9BWX2_ARUDO
MYYFGLWQSLHVTFSSATANLHIW